MFYLIPAPLHRLALKIGYRVRGEWRRRFQRPSYGVSLVARDDDERILLVRHSYGSGRWSLPGGGRSIRENPMDTVRREIREELHCGLEDIRLVKVSHSEIQGAPNISHIYTARLTGEPIVDGRELLAASWFDPAALPDDMVRIARRRIEVTLAQDD